MNISWKIGAIGNASGSYISEGQSGMLNAQTLAVSFATSNDRLPDFLELTSQSGKLADSEDSFIYFFCQIDPNRENFDLSARFEVLDMGEIPHYQTGFGIMAADTVFSEGKAGNNLCRHRNHLLLGRFRTADGRNHGYGLRAVGGYHDPEASEYTPVRKLDPTRVFHVQEEEDRICPGDICTLRLSKTDEGFQAAIQKGETEETLFIPGCDFLM